MSSFVPHTENGAFEESPEILADRFLSEKAQAEGISPDDLLARLVERASRAARSGDCLQPHELQDITLLPEEQKEHAQQCNFCKVLLDHSQPLPGAALQFGQTAIALQRPRRLVNLRWKVEGAVFVSLTALTFGMVRCLELLATHLIALKPGCSPAADAAVKAFTQRASEGHGLRADSHRISVAAPPAHELQMAVDASRDRAAGDFGKH